MDAEPNGSTTLSKLALKTVVSARLAKASPPIAGFTQQSRHIGATFVQQLSYLRTDRAPPFAVLADWLFSVLKSVSSMRLSQTFSILIFLSFLVLALVGWFVLGHYRIAFQKSVQAADVERSGNSLRIITGRIMEREWSSLVAFADSVDTSALSNMQPLTDIAAAASTKVDWVAVIAPDGSIKAASGGDGVGNNVSRELWFQWGLQHPTISEPFKYGMDGALRDYIHLVQPISGENDVVKGIVVYRFQLAWLRDFVSETAAALGVDAFIVDASGRILVASSHLSTEPPTIAAVQAARLSLLRGYTAVETDEPGFVSASLPRALGELVPNNGWSLIVRMKDHLPKSVGSTALQSGGIAVGVLLFLVVFTLLAAVRAFLRPIEILSDSLMKVSKGKFDYPLEFSSSREAKKLGTASVLIQTQLEQIPGKRAS